MLFTLRNKSRNHSKLKNCGYTTPKTDDRTVLSEMDISYSVSYDSWFIKTFWDGKKSYRYNIKLGHLDEWSEFQMMLSEVENDDLFR